MVVSGPVLSHNKIDFHAMSRFLAKEVLKKGFTLEEDQWKDLAPGVSWRRRRFRFLLPDPEGSNGGQPEGLCINEIILDSHAGAEITPILAAEYPDLVDLPEIENAYWATTFAQGAIRAGEARQETRLYLDLSHLLMGQLGRDVRSRADLLRGLEEKPESWESHGDALDSFRPQVAERESGPIRLARYAAAFPPSRLVQSSDEIIAATNAGYFLNFPEEYDDGISSLHEPVGGHMVDGRLLLPCWVERPGVMEFEDGTFKAVLHGVRDMVLRVADLEAVPLHPASDDGPNHGKTWRPFDGPMPAPKEGTVQLAFTGSVLVAASMGSEPLPPPAGGATIWLTGAHASALAKDINSDSLDAEVLLRPFEEGTAQWLVSSGPFLVRDGKALEGQEAIFSRDNAGEFRPNGPPPTRFPYDVDRTAAPRTAIGTTAAGGLKLVVVDGRRAGEHSCGLTLQGLAYLMEKLGCETAINLDGGGSSVMAIEAATLADMLRDNSPFGVVNIPSDAGGRERIMPVFLAVRKKPGHSG